MICSPLALAGRLSVRQEVQDAGKPADATGYR
jgi:hypothetical protein